MKQCPKCGAKNENDAVSCKECGQKIRSAFHIQESEEEWEPDEEAAQERKRRTRHRILIPVLGIPFVLLLKIAYGLREDWLPVILAGAVIPLIGWIKIHKGDWLYSLNARLFHRNDTKPRDDYIIESRIIGVLLFIFCYGWLIWYCLAGA